MVCIEIVYCCMLALSETWCDFVVVTVTGFRPETTVFYHSSKILPELLEDVIACYLNGKRVRYRGERERKRETEGEREKERVRERERKRDGVREKGE